ncbi:MAG TPA: YbaK/EbsC family protein [Thermoanaerobaculia bacterium]|nr:YbaK/EbsC family protein [Thermoanaerobaculia bacterium]
MSSDSLSRAASRVQAALDAAGVTARVVELPDSTRTAVEAANAIGCKVAEIAKSLVFRGKDSGQAVLVITSGTNRVDEKKVAALLGEPIAKADADFVRERTGYAIGGIPPAGHATPLRTLIDEDLLTFTTLWAAAGTPHAVFELTPNDLVRMTGGRVGKVA